LSPKYYRRQAEICTRLASAAGDQERATQFKVLALEMLLRAVDDPSETADHDGSDERENAGPNSRSA
jgi:hypothetical protein